MGDGSLQHLTIYGQDLIILLKATISGKERQETL